MSEIQHPFEETKGPSNSTQPPLDTPAPPISPAAPITSVAMQATQSDAKAPQEQPSSPVQEVEMNPLDREIVASPDSLRSYEGPSSPIGHEQTPSKGHSVPSPLSTHFSHTPFPLRTSESIAAAHAQRQAGMPISPTNPSGSAPWAESATSSRPTSVAMRRISDSSAYSHLSGHRPAPASPGPSRRTSGVLGFTKEEGGIGIGLGNPSGSGQHTLRASSTSKSSMGASSTWSGSGMSRSASTQQQIGRARPPSQLIPVPGRDDDANFSEGMISNTPSRVPSPVEELPDTAIPTSTSEGLLSLTSPQSTSAQSIPSIFTPAIKGQVIVRDFAFPSLDERYHGRALPTSLSATRSSASSDIEDYSGSPGTSKGGRRKSSFGGWGGFSLGGFGWGSLRANKDKRKSSSGSQELGGSGMGGSREQHDRFGGTEIDTDLDLSSDMTPSSSYGLGNESDGFLSSKGAVGESSSSLIHHTTGDYDHREDLADEDVGTDGDDELGPEPRGLYKVVYAFDAEGEPEMSVAEGEVIKVKGRGGGSGWVIGVRWTLNDAGEGVEGQEGLVPESYLDPMDED